MKTDEDSGRFNYLYDAINVKNLTKEVMDVPVEQNESYDFANVNYGFSTSLDNNYGKYLSAGVVFVATANSYVATGRFLQVQNSNDIFRIKNTGTLKITIYASSTSNENSRDLILKTVDNKELSTVTISPGGGAKIAVFTTSGDKDFIIASKGGAIRIYSLLIETLEPKTIKKLILKINHSETFLSEVETFSQATAARDNSYFSGVNGYTYFTRLNFYGKFKMTLNTQVVLGIINENNVNCKVKIYRRIQGTNAFRLVAQTDTNNSQKKAITFVNEDKLTGEYEYYIGVFSNNSTINLMGFNNEDVAEKISPPISFRTVGEPGEYFSTQDIQSSYQTFSIKVQTIEEE
jgi:hypothetical protein